MDKLYYHNNYVVRKVTTLTCLRHLLVVVVSLIDATTTSGIPDGVHAYARETASF